jgi:hypothetical protein
VNPEFIGRRGLVFGLLFLCRMFFNWSTDATDIADLHGLKVIDFKLKILAIHFIH